MPHPLNIAIIAGQLVVGGAERQLYLWLANLDRTLFNPVVITLHPGHNDYWEKPIEDLGIPLFHVYQNKNRLSRLLQIIKILRPFKPQLIHGWHMFSGAYAALAAKLLRVKSIAGIRSNYQALEYTLETKIVRRLSDALVVNSQNAASSYKTDLKSSRQPVFVVKNALLTEFEQRESVRDRLIKNYNLPPDLPWLVSIGRMVPLKRFDVLIQACQHLKDQGVSFHLILVGDGPEKSSLEKLITAKVLTGYVTLTGEVPYTSRWLPAFDIFCFPSVAEGAPNAILEAAAASLPIVACDLPFNREILPSDNMALFVHPGDEVAIAEEISKLLSSPTLRHELGAAAQAHVLATFSLSQFTEALTEVYLTVLKINHA